MTQPLPLTERDAFALESYLSRWGQMTSEEAFTEALWYDEQYRNLQPTDPARLHFARQRNSLTDYAAVLEKKELSAS